MRKTPLLPDEELDLSIRGLRISDLPDVMRIEAASLPNAWDETSLRRFLVGHDVRGFLVESNGAVVGFYMVKSATDQLYILNLAVDRDARRRGIGTFMLEEIRELASAEGRSVIVLDVRETNLAAQLLYRNAGYRAVEIRHGHYGTEDGYRMHHVLATTRTRRPSVRL